MIVSQVNIAQIAELSLYFCNCSLDKMNVCIGIVSPLSRYKVKMNDLQGRS